MSRFKQTLTLPLFCSIKYDTSIWWNSEKHSTNKRNNCCNPYSLSSSRSFWDDITMLKQKIKRSSHRMVIYMPSILHVVKVLEDEGVFHRHLDSDHASHGHGHACHGLQHLSVGGKPRSACNKKSRKARLFSREYVLKDISKLYMEYDTCSSLKSGPWVLLICSKSHSRCGVKECEKMNVKWCQTGECSLFLYHWWGWVGLKLKVEETKTTIHDSGGKKFLYDGQNSPPQRKQGNRVTRRVHPGRLILNLRVKPWKRKIIFQIITVRFYVGWSSGAYWAVHLLMGFSPPSQFSGNFLGLPKHHKENEE